MHIHIRISYLYGISIYTGCAACVKSTHYSVECVCVHARTRARDRASKRQKEQETKRERDRASERAHEETD